MPILLVITGSSYFSLPIYTSKYAKRVKHINILSLNLPPPLIRFGQRTTSEMARYLFVLTLLIVLGGCDNSSAPSDPPNEGATTWQEQVLKNIDVEWYRARLLEQAEGRYNAVRSDGFVYGSISRDWQPIKDKPGTLLHHVRTIYTLVRCYNYFGEKRYLEAAVRAGNFLLKSYADKPGHWVTSLWPSGKVENKRHYDLAYAHLIDALTLLYAETQDRRFIEAALSTWRQLPIWDELAQITPNTKGLEIRRLNSYMHLFEATLSLAKIDPNSAADVRAMYMIEFASEKLSSTCSQGLCYPEYYTTNWKPEETKGAFIDIGHNLEWARMVSGARLLSVSDVQRSNRMEELLNSSLRAGYDYQVGGIYFSAELKGNHDETKLWWGQFELLYTLVHFAVKNNRQDLWPLYQQTFTFVKQSFSDKKNGGFSSNPNTSETESEQPGSGYHFSNMALALIGLHGAAEKEIYTK